MHNYVYISDAKVDLYLPQIKGAIKKEIAASLGFDVKILSGEIKTIRKTLENRIVRLKTVEKGILKANKKKIGTLEQPKSWIKDSANATAAPTIGYEILLLVHGS